MIRAFLVSLIPLTLCFFTLAQTPAPAPPKKAPTKTLKKSTPKKAAEPKEVYDPDNLGPGEIACGRHGSKTAPPCGCMKHRIQVRDEAVKKCEFLEDRKQRMECYIAVPDCPVVTDREHPALDNDGNAMPPQCKRYCSKARCECCTS